MKTPSRNLAILKHWTHSAPCVRGFRSSVRSSLIPLHNNMIETTDIMRSNAGISIVLPAKNEAPNLAMLLPKLRAGFPDAEVIVVDDGSSDDTRDICLEANVNVLSHPYSMGTGAGVQHGAGAGV